jgi:TatD DNase family protein
MNKYDPGVECLYTAIGVHPTMGNEFLSCDTEFNEGKLVVEKKKKHNTIVEHKDGSSYKHEHLEKVKALIRNNPKRVVAIGEIGLDYDRTKFCALDIQREFYRFQIPLALEFKRQ